MPCRFPRTAYRLADGGVSFREVGDVAGSLLLPCGQCVLCRRARSADVASRLVMEGQMHARSVCATLTYSDGRLPAAGSLSKRDAQLWVKRLRERVARRGGGRLRFDLIGEYSPELLRPHYHVALFGYWPSDAKAFGSSRSHRDQFVSAELTDSWGLGHVTFQDWSFGAAGYVSRHQSFKLTGERARERLVVRDAAGLFVGEREPEFRLCSLRPGLGRSWWERFGAQIRDHDFVVLEPGGPRLPPPKYFDKLDKRVDPSGLSERKAQRALRAAAQVADSTDERLAVREACAVAELGRRARREF